MPGGVGGIALGQILADEGQGILFVQIQGIDGDVAGRILGLFHQAGHPALGVQGGHGEAGELPAVGNAAAQQGIPVPAAELLAEIGEGKGEKVVRGGHQQVILDVRLLDGELDVPHGAQARGVVVGSVVHHQEVQGLKALPGALRPGLELPEKAAVGHHNHLVQAGQAQHRFAQKVHHIAFPDGQEGLGGVQRKGVEPGGVPGRQYERLHGFILLNPAASPRLGRRRGAGGKIILQGNWGGHGGYRPGRRPPAHGPVPPRPGAAGR